MKPPRIPAEEAERLFALYRSGLLDTPSSESFDRVTRMAASVLEVPIVLVSLVAEQRQWFKSRFGLDAAQTSREISFCGHAIEQRCPLIVADARLDDRFADNPLVTGSPHIRAYAGMPLFTTDGHAIGTLCAIDRRSRQFTDTEINLLRDFALIIEDVLHANELADQASGVLRDTSEREIVFRDAFEHAAIGIVHCSLSGHLLRANPQFSALLGYSGEQIGRLSFADIMHPDDIPHISGQLLQIAAGGIDNFRVEKRLMRNDGVYCWASLSMTSKKSSSGKPEYLIGVLEDIHERKIADMELIRIRDSLQAEVAEQTQKIIDANNALRSYVKRLLDSERTVQRVERRLRAIADNVPVLIGYWNRELRCEFANEAYRGRFGVDPDEIIDMEMRELVGAETFEELQPHVRLVLLGNPQRFERTTQRIDGAASYSEERFMPDFNEFGQVQGFVSQSTDITASRNVQLALEAAHARLCDSVETDYLTGLLNRAAFTERSEAAIEQLRRGGQAFCLILLDVDRFKAVNDAFGHDAGDGLLRSVGHVLKSHLHDHRDAAARLMEDEFALLNFGAVAEPQLRHMTETIRRQISGEVIEFEQRQVQATVSCGVAVSRADDQSIRQIQARAKAALLEAKGAGRDTCVFAL